MVLTNSPIAASLDQRNLSTEIKDFNEIAQFTFENSMHAHEFYRDGDWERLPSLTKELLINMCALNTMRSIARYVFSDR